MTLVYMYNKIILQIKSIIIKNVPERKKKYNKSVEGLVKKSYVKYKNKKSSIKR